MQPYFIYNNISSSDMGVLVNKLPPITKAPRDMEKIVIPGRDGHLTQDFETYGSTIKTVECTLWDIADIDQVIAWLDGSGEVIFSDQDDRKYQASIINKIPFSYFVQSIRKFIVIFDCQPFALMLDNPLIMLTVQGSIYGAGTYKSKPLITVYGSGTIDLTVNSTVIHLTNVVEHVTIDSTLMDAYKGAVLKNGDMLGEFPELIIGENAISWVGTVTKVEITPNWRWL